MICKAQKCGFPPPQTFLGPLRSKYLSFWCFSLYPIYFYLKGLVKTSMPINEMKDTKITDFWLKGPLSSVIGSRIDHDLIIIFGEEKMGDKLTQNTFHCEILV
jgi:hypothetical protein